MIRQTTVLAASAFACAANVQVVFDHIPLNYNFHGMAHSAAITGGVDEYTPIGVSLPENADTPNGYRSIADRGLVFDPANENSPAYHSGASIGATGMSYAYFNTLGYVNTTAPDAALNGLDIVHLGARCAGYAPASIWAYEDLINTATNVGIAPNWNVCDQSGPQSTSFSPVQLDAGSEIGVLYQGTSGAGQFDVELQFSDHSPVIVRVANPDWFGGTVADPAILSGYPISSQKKISYPTSTGTRTSFQGCDYNDAPRLTTFSTTNAGPNLNVMEAVISVPMIMQSDPTIAGAHLTGISFQSAAYPASGGRGYAVFAATVASGSPTNADCTTPTVVFSGDTPSSNAHAFGAAPSACGLNDTSAVYYLYTASNSGLVQARTCGTTLDTTMTVATSCAGPVIACNDNACGVGSAVSWEATAGQSYLIRVAGNNGATGKFTLHIDDPAHSDVAIPLNYNFHGMAHSASVTGFIDEYTSVANNANADSTNGYRSISDRGLIFDPANNRSLAFYSAQLIGNGAMSYQFFNSLGYSNTTAENAALNGLDIVHIGSRCAGFPPATIYAYENVINDLTNIGVAPAWSVCDQSVTQTTTFSSGPLTIGDNTMIGVLYHASNSGGQFDVTLNFSDHDPIVARVAAPDWFGIPGNPAIVADQPVSYQAKLAHSVAGTTYQSFQGADNNDAPVIKAATTGVGPNLNVMEAVISVPMIVSGVGNRLPDPSVVGAHLTGISFGNATYPAGGRGYAVFAATVRDPAGSGCAADFNGDNQVDFFDYLDFAQAFANEDPSADFNGDNQIDFFDYLDFASAFSAGC